MKPFVKLKILKKKNKTRAAEPEEEPDVEPPVAKKFRASKVKRIRKSVRVVDV